ncbi:SDR family oxidoreductase [Hymenobacter busanensis]|uniref:SDR family oxidoreductase n=1 Tax=Hymenobacter busanensis TaxID=2607656 RepID=A0A7L4ZTF0_9BACT|nr:SDR family oxidoreductase [Hymenobacter busanensis]KAA9325924.1 SDR family oxidoreductase [Hymenobacter busanensis]QHJ06237.1 SDR family NAD(P)-dependent oxidoreductase [Hymenobacter busanensis]
MALHLKKLKDQVIVITGASSGIGLVTARLAAKKGAKLVLAARSEVALRQLVDEIKQAGGQATYVVADVSQPDAARSIAQHAQHTFGGFDTWVNNAGVSIYGKVEDTPIEDMRKLFDVNFWGLVNGSLEAAKHLKQKGGAIINVGSILSDVTAILQTIYSASKHAVKGFTDGLRMELEMDGAPVSVTLIQPAAIDTPYPIHAKNFMEREAKHAPPAYAPETVAKAILHCCATHERSVVVGGGGRAFIGMEHWTPGLLDKFMETSFVKQEKADYPPRPIHQNALDRPMGALEERGNYPGHTRETSYYTEAVTSKSPVLKTALAVGAGLALATWLSKAKSGSSDGRRTSNGHSTLYAAGGTEPTFDYAQRPDYNSQAKHYDMP